MRYVAIAPEFEDGQRGALEEIEPDTLRRHRALEAQVVRIPDGQIDFEKIGYEATRVGEELGVGVGGEETEAVAEPLNHFKLERVVGGVANGLRVRG
jgi:hypothetical protein